MFFVMREKRKTERIQVRAETAEKVAFERAALARGLTLSDWLRLLGRAEAMEVLGKSSAQLFESKA